MSPIALVTMRIQTEWVLLIDYVADTYIKQSNPLAICLLHGLVAH